MTYTFSVYQFSDHEIDQIVALVKLWAKGDRFVPVDGRKFSNQVKDWAVARDLLEKKNNRLYITSCSGFQNKNGAVFTPRGNTPIEALWRLIEPMIPEEGAIGYSITNDERWFENLGIATNNHPHVVPSEVEEKENILLLLTSHGYIDFNMAGTVWAIYRKERCA